MLGLNLNGASCAQTDSTDKPKHELKILETIVFVNPYETDLKARLCMRAPCACTRTLPCTAARRRGSGMLARGNGGRRWRWCGFSCLYPHCSPRALITVTLRRHSIGKFKGSVCGGPCGVKSAPGFRGVVIVWMLRSACVRS